MTIIDDGSRGATSTAPGLLPHEIHDHQNERPDRGLGDIPGRPGHEDPTQDDPTRVDPTQDEPDGPAPLEPTVDPTVDPDEEPETDTNDRFASFARADADDLGLTRLYGWGPEAAIDPYDDGDE